MASPPTIPTTWQSLLDDAATFPPGDAELGAALTEHRGHREAWYADLVGSFVAKDTDLPQVAEARPGPISLIITGGAGAVAGPLALAARHELRIAAVEIALRDPADPAGNARRVVTALDRARDEGVLAEETPAYVELGHDPRAAGPSHGWLAAADVLAESELRLKFRTGGLEPDLFPGAATLATWIDAALERETPFKCTAGLHNALRHTDPETGFTHHGFLNVLLATRASFDSSPRDEVVALLEETDPGRLISVFESYDGDTLARTRRWFTSFGSCSIDEPLADLVALGLVTAPVV